MGCDGNYIIKHLEETSTKECPIQSATFLSWKAAHVSVIYGNSESGKYRVGGINDLPAPFLGLI